MIDQEQEIYETRKWLLKHYDQETMESLFEKAMEQNTVKKGQRKHYMKVFKTFLEELKFIKDLEESVKNKAFFEGLEDSIKNAN